MKRKKPTFLRRAWDRHSKLGKGRRKKQKWRKPTGRHNKLRTQQKGKPASVSIGYGNKKENRGKINGKTPKFVRTISDLEKFPKGVVAILGKMGKKKKFQVAKIAKEKGIIIENLNLNKIIKKGSKNESKT